MNEIISELKPSYQLSGSMILMLLVIFVAVVIVIALERKFKFIRKYSRIGIYGWILAILVIIFIVFWMMYIVVT